MTSSNPSRYLLTLTLVLSLVCGTAAQPAAAAMMGTAQAATGTRAEQLDRVDHFLAQDSVRSLLEQQGVDPADARARVQSLSDSELQRVANNIDRLPAGGSALAVIGLVFVVLVVLEIVGVVNVFKGL
ncbi:MAG: PA2779 family protein [Gammaproteobacteria bacterium]|jgi:cytochrome c-type biogenesis protein CcmH/NrfG|nr:PA2779 family protein [Gammaproteobacteria bacterium]